jgi:hypothetical protein
MPLLPAQHFVAIATQDLQSQSLEVGMGRARSRR